MTTEEKALALVNEIEREEGENELTRRIMRGLIMDEALCRAIEQHEAFRQEVSDAVMAFMLDKPGLSGSGITRFIIPTPKPDPLVKALTEINGEGGFDNFDHYAHNLRAALDALGFEIREKSK